MSPHAVSRASRYRSPSRLLTSRSPAVPSGRHSRSDTSPLRCAGRRSTRAIPAAGSDLEKIKESGYLPEDYVIKLATDAGFKLDAKNEINANPKDTKDYEKGVWTLPPTLALEEKDKDKYLAIGESDRMTLRFVKPGGDQIFKSSEAPKSDAKN